MVPHAVLPSTKTYLRVFVGLGILTIVNVALSYLPVSYPAGLGGKALIVTIQSGLVAHFLLHLRGENRMVSYTMIAALFLTVSLLGTLIPDIGIFRS
jgi:hypothetical protein